MSEQTSRTNVRKRLFVFFGALLLCGAGFLIYAGLSGLLWPAPEGVPADAVALPQEVDSPPETTSPTLPAIGIAVGLRAPDFHLTSLDGDPIALSDFAGHVVIVDFWASWCVPCRSSMPALHALWEGFRDRGVVLLGVSLDRTEAAARAYLEANGYEEMIALWDSLQTVAALYRVSGIPHTLVVDADGIIRFSGHPVRLTVSMIDAAL